MKLLLVTALLALMGCSTMSLQCGVDGASSYVNIQTAADLVPQLGKNIAELCSFASEESHETPTQTIT